MVIYRVPALFQTLYLYSLILTTFMMGLLQQRKGNSKRLNKSTEVTQLVNVSTVWREVS